MASITLTHTNINSGNPVFVQAESIKIGYAKKSSNSPNANYDADEPVVRVQNQSIENPIYTLRSVPLYRTSTTIKTFTAITESLLKDFFVLANDDTDPIILNIIDNTDTPIKSLQKYGGVRVSNIPVTFNGSLDIDLSRTGTNAKLPIVGSIVLMETKKTI